MPRKSFFVTTANATTTASQHMTHHNSCVSLYDNMNCQPHIEIEDTHPGRRALLAAHSPSNRAHFPLRRSTCHCPRPWRWWWSVRLSPLWWNGNQEWAASPYGRPDGSSAEEEKSIFASLWTVLLSYSVLLDGKWRYKGQGKGLSFYRYSLRLLWNIDLKASLRVFSSPLK